MGEGASSALPEGANANIWSNEGLSSYLVCVVEGEAVSPQGAVDIGVVAVEISTGDVLHAQFRCAHMHSVSRCGIITSFHAGSTFWQPLIGTVIGTGGRHRRQEPMLICL